MITRRHSAHFCVECHRSEGGNLARVQRLLAAGELPPCPAAPGGVPHPGGGECPLGMAHAPTGEECVLGCSKCQQETRAKQAAALRPA